MRKVVYVLSHGSAWKVQCEHCQSEIRNTQSEAIKLAKSHVGGLPQGTLSQILIQGSDGKFRAEWTYGSDPFPPAG
ncbi:MAG: DUF2188 domain-containing protein [Oligoflexia bacterium]|nr:DUF2188 domain-containing protein [Oligoflexia bacterium]